MKTHKLIIRFLAFWDIFIFGFFLVLYYARIKNSRLAGDLIMNNMPLTEINPVRHFLDWEGFNALLILIAAVALLSGICLLVKKNWGRVLSIILGTLLLLFGIYLFVINLMSTYGRDPSFVERIIDYFRYMGASLAYIDLGCIIYGIFVIIYFTRKNVKGYITSELTEKTDSLAA
jgi:hypothetical protein